MPWVITLDSSPSIVMVGAGGHARVLQDVLSGLGFELSGFTAPHPDDSQLADSLATGAPIPWLGDDEALRSHNPRDIVLVNGVGSARAAALRDSVYSDFVTAGFSFLTIESLEAHVSPSATVLAGTQVLRGAVVNTDAFIDENCIINSGAIVEHHNHIGRSVHVAVGATLSGNVTVGAGTHIGANATVIQGITIGANCTIAAGAVVISDVPDNSTAVGVPAQFRPSKGSR